MRIAVFTNSYKPTISGVVTSISLFRDGLIAAGHEVFLIAPRYDNYEDSDPFIFRFPSWDLSESINVSFVMPFKAFIAPTLHGIKPDIIHTHHPLLMGDIAASFAQELNIPLIFTFHTRYDEYAQYFVPVAPSLSGKVVDALVKRFLAKCDHIIAPSPSIQDFLVEDYKVSSPVTVVPTPVDLSSYKNLDPERIRAMYGLNGCEVLLYVGRLSFEKNLQLLLDAFALIHEKRPNCRLLILGGGPDESNLTRLADDLDLNASVIFTGPIPHVEVPHYAAASDLFVFPSVSETQGLVLLEAMAAGTPVVAVETPGPSDILSYGGGVLVPAEKKAFADEVLRILADPRKKNSLRKQAKETVKNFNTSVTVCSLIQVYQAAIEAKKQPA